MLYPSWCHCNLTAKGLIPVGSEADDHKGDNLYYVY